MGRKTQIEKEQMLQAAYEILEQDGYSNVNIKTVAAKAGCSTQPISWQFGNMQGLRKELFYYAASQIYAGVGDAVQGKNALEAFFETGKIYLSNAFDYPNVFRFLCVDDPGDIVEERGAAVDLLGDDFIKEMISRELNISYEDTVKIVSDVVIYTHGLAVLVMWEAFKMDKETAYKMIFNQAVMCFKQYGIEIDKYISI